MNRLQLQVPATWTIDLQNEAGKSYFHAMNLLGKLLKEYPDEAFYVHERLQQRINNDKQPAAFVLDDLDWLYELGYQEAWMFELEAELLETAQRELEVLLFRIQSPQLKHHTARELELDLTLIILNLWILSETEQIHAWLTKLSAHNPENGIVLIYKGKTFKSLGQDQEAITCLKQGYFYLARLLDQEEEAGTLEIAEYYRTASELDPDWVEPIHYLAYHLKNYQGQWDAHYLFSQLIQLCPKEPEYYLERGHVFLSNDNHQALLDFNEAIRLSPTNSEAYYYRANTLIKLGRLEDALIDLQFILKIDSKSQNWPPVEEMYLFIAQRFVEKKDLMSGLQAANQACKAAHQPIFRKKSWIASLILCAEILDQLGHFDQALETLNSIQQFVPQYDHSKLRELILQHQQAQS